MIREASSLGPDIVQFVVEAPRVADHARAGQFIIVRTNDRGERVPLTICDVNPGNGTITFVVQAVAESTREVKIPTIASLNPLMVDGTGMCGGCRVRVGTETKFACIDGPEFDAHRDPRARRVREDRGLR